MASSHSKTGLVWYCCLIVYLVLLLLTVAMNKEKTSRMSSVSNSSKFSVKSQHVIAEQNSQIAHMRRIMIAAGIDPDADPDPGPVQKHLKP